MYNYDLFKIITPQNKQKENNKQNKSIEALSWTRTISDEI